MKNEKFRKAGRPRKKLSKTATAVVETVTEKTPITKARRVSEERSLFANKELKACLTVSEICITQTSEIL